VNRNCATPTFALSADAPERVQLLDFPSVAQEVALTFDSTGRV
jgi:hypothetical protein